MKRTFRKYPRNRITANTRIQADNCMWCDEGFFTRDDERDYIEEPLEEFIKDYIHCENCKLGTRCYIDGNNLEVDCVFDGWEFTLHAIIDFRKIRKPSDLGKYLPDLIQQFKDTYDEEVYPYLDNVESCDKITASNIINTNNGDYEITPFGKGFTVQLEGDEVYFDTYEEALAAIMEDAGQTVNAATDIDREFKAVPLRSLKKGAWFTIKPIAEPTDRQVYIKDDYDREEKKFMCGRCDDISYSTYFKGDKMVYDDSNFEY